jgi:hypothetical protein
MDRLDAFDGFIFSAETWYPIVQRSLASFCTLRGSFQTSAVSENLMIQCAFRHVERSQMSNAPMKALSVGVRG